MDFIYAIKVLKQKISEIEDKNVGSYQESVWKQNKLDSLESAIKTLEKGVTN